MRIKNFTPSDKCKEFTTHLPTSTAVNVEATAIQSQLKHGWQQKTQNICYFENVYIIRAIYNKRNEPEFVNL